MEFRQFSSKRSLKSARNKDGSSIVEDTRDSEVNLTREVSGLDIVTKQESEVSEVIDMNLM